jgi:SAM-dependent methyltransferase
MIQNTQLSTSFGAAARDYDRYRVGPPAEIVERIVPVSCETALDLGAGTGAMTRRLMARIPQVYAVEPDPRMREVLAENCPGVTAMEGVAEQIPLADASVDAVVMSAAWHWVDPDRAIPEVARVLRDGGTLALVWNHSDRNVPWISDLDALRRRITGGGDVVYPRIQHFLKDEWLPEGAPFIDIEISELLWSTTLTREELVASQTTYSAYLLESPERKETLLQELTDHVNGDERLGTGETVEVPMRCNFWRAVRKPRQD